MRASVGSSSKSKKKSVVVKAVKKKASSSSAPTLEVLLSKHTDIANFFRFVHKNKLRKKALLRLKSKLAATN